MPTRVLIPTVVLLALAACLNAYDKTGEGYGCVTNADCRAPLLCSTSKVCTRQPSDAGEGDGGNTDAGTPDAGVRFVLAHYNSAYPYLWNLGNASKEVPSLGRYDFGLAAIRKKHVEAMKYGGIGYGAFVWYGPTADTDSDFTLMLDETRDSGMGWVASYQKERTSGPRTVTDIAAVLARVTSRFAATPGARYLTLDGGPALLVDVAYNADVCEAVARWKAVAADAGSNVQFLFHAVGDVQINPGKCAAQPLAWYGESSTAGSVRMANVTTVSPGFFNNDDVSPKLARDVTRFRNDVATWVDGGTPILFVESFNDWLDGNAVESSDSWKTDSGYGAYLDVLHSTLSR